jgi:hypothetical protein
MPVLIILLWLIKSFLRRKAAIANVSLEKSEIDQVCSVRKFSIRIADSRTYLLSSARKVLSRRIFRGGV